MQSNTSIGVIVLAAGASTRMMGSPKQLLPFRGRNLLRHAAETALASRGGPVIVVLGAQCERLRAEIDDLPLLVVENELWAEGMGASIRAGITALKEKCPEISGALLMLCDQPFVTPESLNEMLAAYESGGAAAVASEYDGAPGVPALFDRSLFPELLALQGPAGAKRVLQRHRGELLCLPLPAGALDVDTPADYERLQSACADLNDSDHSP